VSGTRSLGLAELPPPTDPDGSPRSLVTELGERVGEQTAAGWCADLLAGADPAEYVAILGYLGSNCLTAAFDSRWHAYWPRTWGARGLLYVWADSAAATVVAGLGDAHWRPAEMCLKVAARREIGEAGPGAVRLAAHELPRVRAAALRCLGRVGDTEHLETVATARDDQEVQVRRAGVRALAEMGIRLDVTGRGYGRA
jgi:HEAT repeats